MVMCPEYESKYTTMFNRYKYIIYIIDIKENKSISNFGAKSIEILYNCYRIYVKYILSWNRRYIGIS